MRCVDVRIHEDIDQSFMVQFLSFSICLKVHSLGQKEIATNNIPFQDDLIIKEQKTGKERRITLNEAVIGAVKALLDSTPHDDIDPLFKSKKGNKALSVPSVNRLVKGWCREINLKGNYGSHTLRKTFGYMQRTLLNTSVAALMVMFNHSSQRQTLDYLCIQPEEIKNAYLQLKL